MIGEKEPSNRSAGLSKSDLIEEIVTATKITRHEAHDVLEIILDSIVRALRTGDKVEIRHFGSFRIRQRGSRIGRNPRTGIRVAVPPRRIPYFTPSKEIKAGINSE